jgi:heat-inducible transcriptional repressor
VPTEQGLRLFIDSLLKVRGLSPREKDDIRAACGIGDPDLEEALGRVSRMLSDLSHHAAVVLSPAPSRQRLERIEFVRFREGELLAVLVAEGGRIENRVVRAEGLSSEQIERCNAYLNGLAAGLSLEEARGRVLEELGGEKARYDELARQALLLGEQALQVTVRPAVHIAGQAHLLDGPASVGQMRALLGALEEKERFVALLDRTLGAEGIQVWIGAETPFAGASDVSVVATPYGPDEHPVGVIAVVGPTRMNYSRVIPLVDFTAELLSAMGKK